MLHSGLVSVTFRRFSPQEIVKLVVQAGLESIEWGGDIHVPHGDLSAARAVKKMTEDAGLRVSAYGSYYRVGHREPCPFERILETAVLLGAPVIRVWAGKRGSAQSDVAYRELIASESHRIASLAAEAGVSVAYEFHSITLTDTNQSAVDLLEAVDHPNLRTFWQPPHRQSLAYALEGLNLLRPWLLNVHAFHWHVSDANQPITTRFELEAGSHRWREYLSRLARSGGEHFVSLEFVKDDSAAQFLKDASTLKRWITNCSA